MSVEKISSVFSQDDNPKIRRPRADYHPNIWGDRFLNYDEATDLKTHELRKQQIEELKEVIREEVFMAAPADVSNQLKLMDKIQRLGLSYHFEREIEEALAHIHATYHGHDNEDLYDASLRFSLLRQHGYNVSCDTFDKFKDERGTFKECLITNILGLLGFYEASHLKLHGEDILDEALVFTTAHLERVATQGTHPLSSEIISALKRPLRKSLERLHARQYISVYQDEASHNKSLLELATLDFNLVQSLHKREICEISRWWRELDLAGKLPYVRDRVVEIYVCWCLGVYFEPKYSLGRSILAKVCALTSVIDDTYDAYGTFEELELFTDAIQRWDVKCLDQLPEYMQLIYQTVLKLYQEFEDELEENERYRVHYAKEMMKTLVRAYMEEARWLHQGYIPTLEEYMHVALVTSCHSMLTIVSFVGIQEYTVTRDVFEWVLNGSKIVRASTIICRLMDDIVSHKFEHKRDHTPSAVECYIKQYEISEQKAYEELNKQVADAWKDKNEEFLRPTVVPMPILMRVLNFSRVIEYVYKEDDGYTHVGKVAKEAVAALLIKPVP